MTSTHLAMSLGGEVFHLLLPGINSLDAISCIGRFYPLVCTLRNHVTPLLNRQFLGAC